MDLLKEYTKSNKMLEECRKIQQEAKKEYRGKVFHYKGEDYHVIFIDTIGDVHEYPKVRIQSVATTYAGYVKSEDLSIEQFCEILEGIEKMENWKDAIKTLGNFPQRQDSTLEQLEDLVWVANKLGFYDAADAIKTLVINKANS